MTRIDAHRKGIATAAALVFLGLTWAGPTRAADQQLVLDPAATKVMFTLAATLHTVEGEIPLARGTIRFDATTGAASGEIVLDARRAETGNSLRDDNMHSAVLESVRFPRIIFRPTHLEVLKRSEAAADVALHGNLEMYGTSRPLVFPAHLERGAGESHRVTITAHFPVRYVEWGMKDVSNFVLRVADQVRVQVAAEGTLQAP